MRNADTEDKIRVLAFGMTSEIIGTDQILVEGIRDTEELGTWLVMEYPELESLDLLMAVNRIIIRSNTKITPGMEVALLPPFSGG